MIWQEYVFLVGSVGQVFMLLPMVRANSKPPLASSVPVAVTLAVYAVAFVTLDQWLSAVAMGAVAGTWALLAAQRRKQAQEQERGR